MCERGLYCDILALTCLLAQSYHLRRSLRAHLDEPALAEGFAFQFHPKARICGFAVAYSLSTAAADFAEHVLFAHIYGCCSGFQGAFSLNKSSKRLLQRGFVFKNCSVGDGALYL
ncbi:hypothetical protein CC79DRAFT_455301 [Sarocladium strictum]